MPVRSPTKKRGKSRKSLTNRRNKKARKRDEGDTNDSVNVVSADRDGVFFEAESIVDARKTSQGWEYRVRWKGFKASDDTWEPETNLCDSLYEQARTFKIREGGDQNMDGGTVLAKSNAKTHNEPQLEGTCQETGKSGGGILPVEDEKKVSSAMEKFPDSSSSEEEEEEDSASSYGEDEPSDLWEWNDREQIEFREVERIDVNDADARRRVTDARLSGVPVVLRGHKGWAQFARCWLKRKGDQTNSATCDAASAGPSPTCISGNEDLAKMRTMQQPTDYYNEEMKLDKAADVSCHKEFAAETTPDNGLLSLAELENQQPTLPSESVPAGKNDIALQQTMPPKANTEENERKDKVVSEVVPPELLDLEQNEWELDLDRMSADIGSEEVPIVLRNYSEQNPIARKESLSKFLKTGWPSDPNSHTGKHGRRPYLHQWQFPLSSTAQSKLCGQGRHTPLENDIIGEDILSYWLDPEKCGGDNPFQYLFMGREETFSKLHKDAGGLLISIAPIIGKKECLMVHRSDGTSCLYHLKAKLDKINLQKYPMLCHARIFKTVVSPGEILLMPQNTYHQCRNVTPCLSYHKFHLDTVNLRPFLESWINKDAPEIQHLEVIWNAACELHNQIDDFVKQMQEARKGAVVPSQPTDLSPEIIRKVNTLRALRNVCREIWRRFEEQSRHRNSGTCESGGDDVSHWTGMVRDIDMALHNFRYRNHESKPPFRPFTGRREKSKVGQSAGAMSSQQSKPVGLEADIACLPLAPEPYSSLTFEAESLCVNSGVEVRLGGHRVTGVIKEVVEAMQAALLEFDEFPPVYNEYYPRRGLFMPVSGDSCTEIRPKDVHVGKPVILKCVLDEYLAVVKSLKEETFIFVHLDIGENGLDRWLPQSDILKVFASTGKDKVGTEGSEPGVNVAVI